MESENTEKAKKGNKPKYTPEEFAFRVDTYFRDCEALNKDPGFYGLAAHMGMSARAIRMYETGEIGAGDPRYAEVMEMARMRLLAHAESKIYKHTAGAVAQLVNLTRAKIVPNEYKYKNAMHVENTGPSGGPIPITIIDKNL